MNQRDPAAEQGAGRLLEDLSTLSETARSGFGGDRVERLREGELRPVAVLYTEITGLNLLSRELESGQFAALTERLYDYLRLEVNGYGGYCNDVAGSTLLFLFPGNPSYPPPRRAALRAGLAVFTKFNRLGSLPDGRSGELDIRLGASFGEVARQEVGNEVRAVGSVINLAQRLATAGEPGGLICDAAALEGNRSLFRWDGPEPLELKGIGETDTFRVHGERRQRPAFRGGSELTPLVAREEELAELTGIFGEWLEPASGPSRSEPGLFVLRGSSGVGKTRLAWELIRRIKQRRDCAVGVAQSRRFGGGMLALAGQLVRIAGITPENLENRYRELLEAAGETAGEETEGRLATLSALLEEVPEGGGPFEVADYESFRAAVYSALSKLLELVHRERGGLLLLLDDLQWLGGAEELVVNLLEGLGLDPPPAVIATMRHDGEVPTGLGEVSRVRQREVEPLERGQAKRLIQERLPGLELPEELWDQVLERAEGLPYFLEEFAVLLVDEGFVERDSAGLWSARRDLEKLTLPQDLRALLLGRLDALPGDLRDTALHASVLGRVFATELLEQLERRLGRTGPAETPAAINSLVEAGLLAPGSSEQAEPGTPAEPESPAPDRLVSGHYSFRNPMTREVAYSALLSHNRELLHALAAECIDELYPTGTMAGLDSLADLVRHLHRAGEYRRGIERSLELLERAAETGRFELWQNSWQRAQEMLDELGEAGETSARRLPDSFTAPEGLEHLPDEPVSEDRLRLHLKLAGCKLGLWTSTGEQERAFEAGRKLLELPALDQLDGMKELRAKLELITGRAANHLHRGEAAVEHLERARKLFSELGDRSREADIHGVMALVRWRTQELELAESNCERAMQIFQELGDTWSYHRNLLNLGILTEQKGDPDRALEHYERALSTFRELGDVRHQAKLVNNMAILFQHENELGKAEDHYRDHLRLARDAGMLQEEGRALGNLAGVIRLRAEGGGDESLFAEAEQLYREAVEHFSELGDGRSRGVFLSDLADLKVDRGELEESREMFREAEELLSEAGDELFLTLLHLRLARALIKSGEREAARERAGLALSRRGDFTGVPADKLEEEIGKTREAFEEHGEQWDPEARQKRA